jgi:DNA-binding response OmpR family regulator
MSPSLQASHALAPEFGAATIAPRILLAGGDTQVRRALRVTLMSAGYVVVEAWSSEEALDKVQAENAVDIVVLDFETPGIGGLEACIRIRKLVDTPILAISIFHDPQDKVQASDAGADDYLVKPFGIQDFLSRIHALRRKTTSPEFIPAPWVIRSKDSCTDTVRA